MAYLPQHKFRTKLLKWWKKNGRKFPWRETKDPYLILISEILLHRTKADQVVPIYNKIVNKFSTINYLGKASGKEVKELLYPLGLHWRTNSLLEMVQEITNNYNGKIPVNKNELKSLPGISDYISSAVRCFSFNLPEVLLDTNTVRILGRFFGIEVTDGSRRSKKFQKLYQYLIDKKHPREFNYAMIDLGALVCRSSHTKCGECPVSDLCCYKIFKR